MCTARELLFLRHGKSAWGSDAVDDFHRPLARRGRKAVKCMASWLRRQDLLPEHILSSTAERARQTALRLCRHADIPESRVEWHDAIYAANLEALLHVLVNAPQQHGRVMIIGHNPGLEDAIEILTGSFERLPTCALARISLPIDDWEELSEGVAGELIGTWLPRELFGE